MANPWLDLPLADYEQHMALPQVGQAQLLSRILAETLHRCQPDSLAIVGCAGGNGLERVIDAGLQRIIGIDINESYVRCARSRFGHRIPGLEFFVGDIETAEFGFEPVDLVFAGLVFEYVDVCRALSRIHSILRSGGKLVTVLQLPGQTENVTPTPFTSLEALSSIMQLVPPERFTQLACEAGFDVLPGLTVEAKGGKQFFVHSSQAHEVTKPNQA